MLIIQSVFLRIVENYQDHLDCRLGSGADKIPDETCFHMLEDVNRSAGSRLVFRLIGAPCDSARSNAELHLPLPKWERKDGKEVWMDTEIYNLYAIHAKISTEKTSKTRVPRLCFLSEPVWHSNRHPMDVSEP